MIIVLYMIGLLIYMAVPFLGKLAIMILNMLVPDPLPYIDEIVMFLGLCKHLNKND